MPLAVAESAPAPGPFVALMVLGFVVGVAGHVVHSRLAVAVGIALVFAATLALPVAFYLTG